MSSKDCETNPIIQLRYLIILSLDSKVYSIDAVVGKPLYANNNCVRGCTPNYVNHLVCPHYGLPVVLMLRSWKP